ncbi:hypothetical protein VTL71DRAFT_1235 [Oculimacula yallundae]|uniref:Glucose-methanol-choline oxidoreductase N-terminal domain-containing protein n=1 Tax=Oculimacula yallundae TaxID=86028 RepID=A0ABR4CC15_9HELO
MLPLRAYALPAFVCVSLSIAASIPSPGPYQILSRADQVEKTYDYVIVGGGTAGLTVGDRLSESGKYTVLVIEYGILDNATEILSGGAFKGMHPSRQFDIKSAPQPELNNRSITATVGKAVGGSSAINGMQYLRGTSDEYDMWAELGVNYSTWNWGGLLPYFKKGVHFVPPLDAVAKEFNITYDIEAAWGQDPSTHVYAGFPNYQLPELKYMYDAMSKMPNVDLPRDGNAGTNGLYWYPSQMDPRTYTRSYARTGHWDNISRSNYQLMTSSKVTKIQFSGTVATGVEFTPVNGSQITSVKARKEVILAAGALHTPQILQLSGIGPAYLLKEAGIAVKVDLPGVGANFQDHGWVRNVAFKWTTPPPVPSTTSGGDPSTSLTWSLGALLGLPAISPSDVDSIAAKYEDQNPEDFLPSDTHPDILAGYAAQKQTFTRIMKRKNVNTYWQILTGASSADPMFHHPVSRGTVNIDPSNLAGEPVVDYRAFSNPFDLDMMIEIVKFVRKFFASAAFAPYGPVETRPGPNVTTTSDLKEWIKANYMPSVYHPVGTASLMRRELGGVVGEDLLVYGVSGLSVVDASIMPIIPGCPTAMTVYAVAEKAADLIKARQ